MATRVISTSIKLDGEAEFKKQLSSVNSNLKNLNSDMRLVTEEFKGQANSLDALTAKDKILNEQVAQQKEKVQALEQALTEATDAYGENDKRVDDYRRSLNNAKADLIKLERELDQNTGYLDEAKKSADGAAKSIDGFGKEVKAADKKADSFGDTIDDVLDALGGIKGALVGGAAVGAIKELGSSIMDLEESTREYRSILGTLAVSSEAAGYSADETAAAYDRLSAVLNDPQMAATTVANLQAIGLEQKALMEILDDTIGAWATYGDSIPIDGLAESINETVQAGQVTGTFADVLNWAGTSEDDFNEKLAAANSSTERANLVLQELSRQGLTDAANSWFEVNEDITKANESEERMRQAWAELGEALSPVANWLRDTLGGALEWVTEKISTAIQKLSELKSWWDKTKESWSELKEGGVSGVISQLTSVGGTSTTGRVASVTQGLTGAELRERGVTSADVYNAAAAVGNAVTRSGSGGSGTTTVKTTISIDSRAVAEAITPALRDTDKSNPEVVSDKL